MLIGYESEIVTISEMYQQANKLVILYETYHKIGNLSFTYELKDSYNHLMDAINADIKLQHETDNKKIAELHKEISSELEGARKHLFRLIFDAGEAAGLIILNQVSKIFDRYPKTLVKKVYPKMDDEIKPEILGFLNTLKELKIEKSSSCQKTVSDKIYNWAFDVEKFANEKLEKNKGYKWSIFWTCVSWLATVVASGVIGYAFSLIPHQI